MKKRWMKSVIEASKEPVPALPFQHGWRPSRRIAGSAPKPVLRKLA